MNGKIGIGVTTYHRPECYDFFIDQLLKCMPFHEYQLHVAHNIPNVAIAKNECLFHLKDCEFIFLFDDDCFPIQPHWDLPFIKSGHPHLLYMNETYQAVQKLDDVTRYKDCSGCFMFITRSAFLTVGYFNAAYGQYGYEHMGYSNRILRATKDWAYLCLNTTRHFIYSLDLQGMGPYKIHHSKISDNQELSNVKKKNLDVFNDEIVNDKIYYEYR